MPAAKKPSKKPAKKTAAGKSPAKKTSARKTAAGRTSGGKSAGSGKSPVDAVQLLTAEHKEVKDLFKQYQKLVDGDKGDEEKQALARQICSMLTVHATTEEEIFYPAARDALEDEDLLDEAEVEHGSAKELIAQIESSSPDEDLYDAKVKVLGEYIEHHVKEEEGELFPKAKKAKLDLVKLGELITARKGELTAEVV